MPKKTWSKGAKKAYAAITQQYGKEQGEHIFYGRATKIAGATTPLNQRVSKAFKTGGTQKPRRKR